MPFGDTVGKSVNLCTEFLTTVRCELPCVSVPSIEKLLPAFFLICNTAPFCAIVNPRFSKKKQGTFPKTRQLGKGVQGPKEMIPASLQGVTQYNPVIRIDVKLG